MRKYIKNNNLGVLTCVLINIIKKLDFRKGDLFSYKNWITSGSNLVNE